MEPPVHHKHLNMLPTLLRRTSGKRIRRGFCITLVSKASTYRAFNRYKRRSKNEQLALWEELFARPNEWWDQREEKAIGSRKPDFKHREDYTKALWIHIYNTDKVKPDIKDQLEEMDRREDFKQRPITPPSNQEAFHDLVKNPQDYVDLRSPAKSEQKPDFKHVETLFPIWLSSVPKHMHSQLDNVAFHRTVEDLTRVDMEILDKGNERQSLPLSKLPRISLGIESPEDVVKQRKESPNTEPRRDSDDDREWLTESSKKAIDVLINFEHDLSEEAYPPEGVLALSLLQYQRQGLAWMLRREENTDLRGGMLCDQQGLGKTIQALGLIASNPCRSLAAADLLSREEQEDTTTSYSSDEFVSSNKAEDGQDLGDDEVFSTEELLPIKATLVIMPLSVLRQWQTTIETQTKLKVLPYTGSKRDSHQDPASLAEYDVVLASYNIALYDSPHKSDKALYRVKWWRIILDEMQFIKNHQGSTAAAVALLEVQDGGSRWLMSGTPFQNHCKEFYSYFHFLRLSPYNDYAHFSSLFVQTPMSQAVEQLAGIIRPIMLRRTKESTIEGKRILTLPGRLISKHEVTRKIAESDMYLVMEEWVVKTVQDKMREAHGESNDSKDVRRCMLTMLLMLRRGCDHPWLTHRFWADQRRAADVMEAKDKPSSRIPAYEAESSGKIEELIQLVNQHPEDKVIVFSMWTGMLDLIEVALVNSSIGYQRLDGSHRQEARREAIQQMRDDPENRVFLVSLMAGKEGLNLQFCNRVVLIEPDYNPSAEEQAIDRCHRIGQTRDVHVHKFYIKDTVEEQIFALQEYKLALAAKLIDPKDAGRALLSNENLANIVSEMQKRHPDLTKPLPSMLSA